MGALLSGAVGAGAAAGQSPSAGQIKIALPTTIYAVPGLEMNVYFDDVTLAVNLANYAFDVSCPKGNHQSQRWTYTPAAADVGEYPLSISVLDQANALVAGASSTIRVVPAEAGAGANITLLAIGDSLTDTGAYTQHLLDLCKPPGNPRLKLIGSRGPKDTQPDNRHEGRGGWTAQAFAANPASPFVVKDADGKTRLDFAEYCKQFNDGQGPDFVTILLGCNDTFPATDANIEGMIDVMLSHYDLLIDMIHAVRKDTVIGAVLLVPPAATQDAFGANYACDQTRWQYKRNQFRVVQRMIERYAGREADNVYLVPANVNLDCVRNYPRETVPANARTADQIVRQCNGCHPDLAGYRQIGDTLYCWLKARLPAPKPQTQP